MEYQININGQEITAFLAKDIQVEKTYPRMVDLNEMIRVEIETHTGTYTAYMTAAEYTILIDDMDIKG